jgi:hypothetical protein
MLSILRKPSPMHNLQAIRPLDIMIIRHETHGRACSEPKRQDKLLQRKHEIIPQAEGKDLGAVKVKHTCIVADLLNVLLEVWLSLSCVFALQGFVGNKIEGVITSIGDALLDFCAKIDRGGFHFHR